MSQDHAGTAVGSANDRDGGQDRGLPEIAEKQIAAELRKVYGQILAEPMPEKFAGLLDQLAKSERNP